MWLIAIMCAGFAQPPAVTIEAAVSDDLTSVHGIIIYDPSTLTDVQWVDALSTLPLPEDDRTERRTFSGKRRRGSIRYSETAPGTIVFESHLPERRFGDIGAWRKRALFANGTWYPQPLVDGRPPQLDWTVSVDLPAASLGVVSNRIGIEQVRWSGQSERVPLAVRQRWSLDVIEGGDHRVISVGPPGRRRHRRWQREPFHVRMKSLLSSDVVAVEAPLRRRMVRPAMGMVYISDRTWRLTPGLAQFHDASVIEAVAQSTAPGPDYQMRMLDGALRARSMDLPRADELLKYFRWNPVVDAVLNDRRMPFWSEIFRAAHHVDPLKDDLMERYAPHGPIGALADQIKAISPDIDSFETASQDAQVASMIIAWQAPYQQQDLVLTVNDDAIVVDRLTSAEAPPEVLEVSIDGRSEVRRLPAGPSQVSIALTEPPKRVIVDANQTIAQTDRAGDAWPRRSTVLAAAWIDSVNLTEGFFQGHASAWRRGKDDVRTTVYGWLQADQRDYPALTLGGIHRRGPAQDGLNRPHRFALTLTGGWTHPRFSPDERAVFSLRAGLGYTWDTRISALFPIRGHRISIGGSTGYTPADREPWGRAYLTAGGIVSPHPRVALVGRSSIAVAAGRSESQLLWLGGPGAGVSLRPGTAFGTHRAVAEGEVRWEVVRDASIPLAGIAWLSAVQVTAGSEWVSFQQTEADWAHLYGITVGASLVGDLLGAKPGLMGVTVGVPAWTRGLADAPEASTMPLERAQATIRIGQAL